MSLALTDPQIVAITNVALPLAPTERAGFMAELFEELLGRRYGYSIGDGELGRLLRDLQRRYFVPPETEDARTSNQSRHGPRERAFERRSGIRGATCPSAG